jgi:tripartite-type tricarboxylate transporter receptor subunit TctC
MEAIMTIRPCIALACLAALAPALHAAETAKYPQRPVRIIAPFSPGGGSDQLARGVAQRLGERMGQQFVVDNRPGAGGVIGMELTATANPDGYTIAVISGTLTAGYNLLKKPPYDLVRDFAPITWATSQPYVVLVNPSLPAKTLKELIALARAKPGAINYGSSGVGSVQHLTGIMLSDMAGIDLFHISYKGGAMVLADVIAGQIQLAFINPLVAISQIKSGKVRALAVTTQKRLPALPDLPAVAEFVPGFEVNNWYGFIAPAKVPRPILERLNREMVASLSDPQLRDRLQNEGSQVVASTPAEMAAHMKADVARWAKIIHNAGARLQ